MGSALRCTLAFFFRSPKYQESKNCKKELSYADDNEIPIVPVMLQRNWKATSWLGLVTAGLLWIDFRNSDNIETRIESLAKEIVHRAAGKIHTHHAKIVIHQAHITEN